ncbi:gamma-glutamyltransferase [Candidatus Thorarchaeota archaeon]|nr:MAG: gamma-glutamyltransferase [Candidatus Thorarchaeota archaeon]
MFWRRPTGRSDVLAKYGIVASSQPLASQAGLRILQQGGNAADAAIAAAAVLDVVEPFSTGCGGDAFALVHLPGNEKPISFNGSGRAGSGATLDDLLDREWQGIPLRGGPPITVPGAMHLWGHLLSEFGNLELSDVLQPAINYAQNGFPVSPLIAQLWNILLPVLGNDDARRIFTIDGSSPEIGDIMYNQDLARTFQTVAETGVKSFYEGEIAERIVSTTKKHSGFLELEDLATHETEQTTPISTSYNGLMVFEHPPNGQGFAALEMINIMEQFPIQEMGEMSTERFHAMIEGKKLAYDDLYRHNADPDFYDVPIEQLLSKDYALSRANLIDMNNAMDLENMSMKQGPDTVYLATADEEGMAVSFINSLYMGFGSGLVAEGTGIKLQNRGNLFSLDPTHPNHYEPGKRPFHTIIPGALYRNKEFFGVFGIMGGAHQAQAHAQFVSHIADFDRSPQAALDFPRFHHDQESNTVALENGIKADIQGQLRLKGHRLVHETSFGFGGGQAIFVNGNAWIAGSDYRKDGQAVGY